jgi:hypothetical protein
VQATSLLCVLGALCGESCLPAERLQLNKDNSVQISVFAGMREKTPFFRADASSFSKSDSQTDNIYGSYNEAGKYVEMKACSSFSVC